MKKRLVGTMILVLLLNFALVMAECEDSQTIMKLSGSDNAHASLWNESEYTTKICYEEIFEGKFTLPSEDTKKDPHRCTKINQMVSLYDVGNSHVSNIGDSIYDTDVCFGNLQCFFEESKGDGCEQGELTARMYRSYNSHVGTAEGSDYSIKVCCTDTYMTNTDFKITNKANLGDTVYFVSPPNIDDIKIKVDGPWIFDSDVDKIKSSYNEDLMANIIEWKIPEEAIKGETTKLIVKIGDKEFNIEVGVATDDSPMILGFGENIKCGNNYTQGSLVTIEALASDEDNSLKGAVYANGKKIQESDFENQGITLENYLLDEVGEVKLEVNATNSDGKEASYITNIIVTDADDGEYTAACIKSPKNYEDFDETYVDFDASTTRGIIVRKGVANIIKPEDKYPFIFNWKVAGASSKGGIPISETFSNKNGDMDDWRNESYYKFRLKYPGVGVKKANLEVEFPSSIDWEKELGL